MKLSILSFLALGAGAALAAPLDRHVQPVRRTEAAAATPTPAPTSTGPAESVPTETATYLYSTITNSESLVGSTVTETLPESTVTVSTVTIPEIPQETSVGSVGSFATSRQVIVQEVVRVTQVVVVEKPVFIAVHVNQNVRQQIFFNQFQGVFRSRFDNWDAIVVNQLASLVAQHFDLLSRHGNRGFDVLNQNIFNTFVSKFVQQFSVFQQIQLVQVQQLVVLFQQFNAVQVQTFFGRSDLLFGQDVFDQFNINNNFDAFVQNLVGMLDSIQGGAFNNDGIFNLGNGLNQQLLIL